MLLFRWNNDINASTLSCPADTTVSPTTAITVSVGAISSCASVIMFPVRKSNKIIRHLYFKNIPSLFAVCYSGQMYNNLASQSLFIPLKRVYTSYQTVRLFRFHTSKGPVLPFRQIFLCPVSFCCKTCRRSKSVVLPRFPA